MEYAVFLKNIQQMKSGNLYKIKCYGSGPAVWSLSYNMLGHLNNNDIVMYVNDGKNTSDVNVISKYGLCAIYKIYLYYEIR
jgi:hypothetical protein